MILHWAPLQFGSRYRVLRLHLDRLRRNMWLLDLLRYGSDASRALHG